MSETPRGPLIQRQGFIKRAPSGKLSAFKKWEKKWCVFALSRRNGPVLDFFDNRSETGNGPAGALGRIELKLTKQVCAAIQCKVPYTFIIVTDTKIVSLAAQSQSDAESWISCLRRVLSAEGCLQSSEDHTYEVSGNAVTRQDQERQARAKRRPPTPPESDSELVSSSTDGVPLEVAPPPPPHAVSSSSVSPQAATPNPAPLLPKRASKKGLLPPPIPTTNRPRRAEYDFTPKSKRQSCKDDPRKNMQEVLLNYVESTDTTYEFGDRRAIQTAHTLNSRDLANALEQYATRPSTSPAAKVADPPVYSKINKNRAAEDSRRPPVAPRRVQTLRPRVEHDFSPRLLMRSDSSSSESSDSESSSGDDMEALLAQRAAKRASTDAPDDEADDMYTTLEGFADDVLNLDDLSSRLAAAGTNDDDDEDDRYGEVPVRPTTLSTNQNSFPLPLVPNLFRESPAVPKDAPTTHRMSPTIPRESPVTPREFPIARRQSPINPRESPTAPTQLPSRSQELPSTPKKSPTACKGSPNAALPKPDLDFDDNVYENSKTVLDDLGAHRKAVPAPAPRRANTVRERTTRSVAPRPSVRRPPKKDDGENDDAYENFLGEFGMGVSSNKGGQPPPVGKHNVTDVQQVPSKFSRLNTGQVSSINNSRLPLPPAPSSSNPNAKPNGASVTAQSAISNAAVNGPLDVNVPVADGESCGSSLSSPVVSPSQSAEPSLPRSDGRIIVMQLGITSIANANNILPAEEAPPPYTPARIINDSQLNNNMDCIAEGDSDVEKETPVVDSRPTNQTQSFPPGHTAAVPLGHTAAVPLGHTAALSLGNTTAVLPEPIYDSHPAFVRPIQLVPSKETNVDGDIGRNINKSATQVNNLGLHRKYSPRTPPGTPPLSARRVSPSSGPSALSAVPQTDNVRLPSEGEDVVLRLEDNFPKMQQQKHNCKTYLEDVVTISPTSTDTRYSIYFVVACTNLASVF